MKTYGRKTIYVPYSNEQIIAADDKKLVQIAADIIESSKSIHSQNKTESLYLKDYLKGIQDIYTDKIKHTRPEIDNHTVENWAWCMVDFKKSYLLGKSIQYVQADNEASEEIAELNKYIKNVNKKAKDQLLYEDVLTCGRGFRFKNYVKPTEENETPFEIINPDVENTECVYSNRMGKEQIGSYVVTSQEYIDVETDPNTNEQIENKKTYNEYTFYFKHRMIVLNDKYGKVALADNVEKPIQPIILQEHVITEYYTNTYRLSIIEIAKDLFNDINYLESLDKDDMEQFVNAIMVFTNAEVTEKEIEAIKKLGAVCISSTENKKASIELLQQRLKAGDTQVYYTRLLTALHQILGVPMASDNGTVTSGDTGKAKLTGQGYTTAGIRAEGEETMFGMCDIEALKGIIKACKLKPNGFKTLKIHNIEPKFFRDMSDNLMTKAQALLSLYNADIPRSFANAIVGLFGDPNAVTKAQEEMFGPQTSQLNKGSNTGFGNEEENQDNVDEKDTEDNVDKKNTNVKIQEEQNIVKKVTEQDEQEQ